MSLFAGMPRPVEMIASGKPQIAKYHEAKNIHLFSGAFYLCYQRGFINWLEEWNPDALIVEANPRYLSTSSAVKWMHARGRKVIGWGLGSPNHRTVQGSVRQANLIPSQFDAHALVQSTRRG